MDCIVCGSSTKVLYNDLTDKVFPIRGEYTIKECPKCKLMLIDPQPGDKELLSHYPETYDVYLKIPSLPNRKKMFLTMKVAKEYFGYGNEKHKIQKVVLLPFYFKLSHLPFYKKNGRLLNVGCSTGNRLLLFRELGWEVEGIEIDKKAASIANSLDFKIYNTSLEKAILPKAYFDVVYLNNVFEHIKKPRHSLEKIVHSLKNNGELILVVPNASSLGFKLFKQNWFALEVPRHLFTYNKTNLSKLLTQFGFKIEKIIYSNTLECSFASLLARKLNQSRSNLTFFDNLVWALNLLIDPIANKFEIGDWMTVRAKLEKS